MSWHHFRLSWGYWVILTWSTTHAILFPSMVQRKSSGIQSWSHSSQENDNDEFPFSLGNRLNRQIFDFDKELPIHSANLIALPSKLETPTGHESVSHPEQLPFSLEYLPPPPAPPTLEYLPPPILEYLPPPSLEYLPPNLDYLPPLPAADSSYPSLNLPTQSPIIPSIRAREALSSLHAVLPLPGSSLKVQALPPVYFTPPEVEKLEPSIPIPPVYFTPPDKDFILNQPSKPEPVLVQVLLSDKLPWEVDVDTEASKPVPTTPASASVFVSFTTSSTSSPLTISNTSNEPSLRTTSTSHSSPWDGVDPCTHAFHRWLCEARKPRPKTAQALPIPTTTTTTTTTPPLLLPTTTLQPPVPEVRIPAASNIRDTFFPTSRLPLITTVETLPSKAIGSWEGVDPCTHAFHRWLCQDSRPKPTSTTPNPTILTRPTPIPTTPIPFIPEIARVPEASNPRQETLLPFVTKEIPKPRTVLEGPTTTEPWSGADPCTHAFHAHLCRNKVLNDTPGARIAPVTISSSSDNNVVIQPAPATTRRPFVAAPPPMILAFMPPPFPTTTAPWEGADPRYHAFHAHSYQPPQHRSAAPPITSATSLDTALIVPEQPKQSFAPQVPGIVPEVPHNNNKDDQHGSWKSSTDPCSHFLHAWRCTPANKSSSRRSSWHHRMTRHYPFLSAVTDYEEASIVMDSVDFEAQRTQRRHAKK